MRKSYKNIGQYMAIGKVGAFIALFLFTFSFLFAQDSRLAETYVCTKGKAHFFASTPMEDIEATNSNTVCVLNTKTKNVSAKVQMTNCIFKSKLMQEHFNENYMESDKFPYGTLNAVIAEDIDYSKDGVYDVTLKGTFEVHGVKRPREIKGKLTIKNGQPVEATAVFDVKLADHNIQIPTVVVAKIAEVVKVDVDFIFQKYQ